VAEQSSKPLAEYRLKNPVQHGETSIDVLEVYRRLTMKDWRGVKTTAQTMDDQMLIVARLTAQPLGVIEKMDSDDFFDALDVFAPFLPSGR